MLWTNKTGDCFRAVFLKHAKICWAGITVLHFHSFCVNPATLRVNSESKQKITMISCLFLSPPNPPDPRKKKKLNKTCVPVQCILNICYEPLVCQSFRLSSNWQSLPYKYFSSFRGTLLTFLRRLTGGCLTLIEFITLILFSNLATTWTQLLN